MQEDGAMKRSLLMVSLIITIIVTNKIYALAIAPVDKSIEIKAQRVEPKKVEILKTQTYYIVPLDIELQDYIIEE